MVEFNLFQWCQECGVGRNQLKASYRTKMKGPFFPVITRIELRCDHCGVEHRIGLDIYNAADVDDSVLEFVPWESDYPEDINREHQTWQPDQ